jgi:hypothetical protein
MKSQRKSASAGSTGCESRAAPGRAYATRPRSASTAARGKAKQKATAEVCSTQHTPAGNLLCLGASTRLWFSKTTVLFGQKRRGVRRFGFWPGSGNRKWRPVQRQGHSYCLLGTGRRLTWPRPSADRTNLLRRLRFSAPAVVTANSSDAAPIAAPTIPAGCNNQFKGHFLFCLSILYSLY